MFYLPYDEYLQRYAIEAQRHNALRNAELEGQLRHAGVDLHGWPARLTCRLLGQIGYWLVTLGERLQRYDTRRVAFGQRMALSRVALGK